MKKQNIIIISIIVILVIVGFVFFFMGKSSNQENKIIPQEQNQNNEGTSIASLAIGNWVSVIAEKSNGSYTASMIMACESKNNCSDLKKPTTGSVPTDIPSSENLPTGPAPADGEGNRRISDDMVNKKMLSGTITEINVDTIVLSLDTGETATVLISDSTKINKR